MPLLFGAADVVALPYRDVLTSGNLMLAANYGKPVVAPRLPALSLRSTHSRFGSVYHDLTPEQIKGHVQDWTISPSLSGQKSRIIPRDYIFIPADHVGRMRISAGLTRDFDDMIDRYFDSFALSDVSALYVPDLIACHRDDVLPWSS